MSATGRTAWEMWGAILAGATLLAFVVQAWVMPAIRRYRLRHPCDVHFVIRGQGESPHTYAIQDDEKHHVRELVLPPHSNVHIEIGSSPKFHFHEREFIFGCDGDKEQRPRAIRYRTLFVLEGVAEIAPGQAGHFIDIHRYYHIPCDKQRNVGSHYVVGLELVTGGVGQYKTNIGYLTDEIQGEAELSILVEQPAKTRMKCILHRDCMVRPQINPQEPQSLQETKHA